MACDGVFSVLCQTYAADALVARIRKTLEVIGEVLEFERGDVACVGGAETPHFVGW